MKYFIVLAIVFYSFGFSQAIEEKIIAAATITDEQDPPENIQVDTMPRPINSVAPKYPESARKLGIEGMVWLKLVVDEKGDATKITVIRSNILNDTKGSEKNIASKEAYAALDDLHQAAIVAAKQWKFNPAILNGKPVKVWVTVPFKFKLDSPHKEEKKTKK